METRNQRFGMFSRGVKMNTLSGVGYPVAKAGVVVSLVTLVFLVLLALASQHWALIPVFVLYLVSLPTLVRFVGARMRRELLRTLGNAPSA